MSSIYALFTSIHIGHHHFSPFIYANLSLFSISATKCLQGEQATGPIRESQDYWRRRGDAVGNGTSPSRLMLHRLHHVRSLWCTQPATKHQVLRCFVLRLASMVLPASLPLPCNRHCMPSASTSHNVPQLASGLNFEATGDP